MKKPTFEQFIEVNETQGWDKSIKYIFDNTEDKYLLNQCKNYEIGYNYCIDNDIDGGKCFQIREKAIHNIMQYLENN